MRGQAVTNYKISQLSQLTALAPGDLLAIVDIDDTSTSPAGSGGSDKQITATGLTGVLTVTPSGVTGGGTDPGNLNAAISAMSAAGGGIVRGSPSGPWYLNAAIVMKSGVTLDMTGCVVTEVAGSNVNMITNLAATTSAATGTGSMTSGGNTLTTSLGASAVVGQSVYVAGASNGGANVLCGIVGAQTSTTITVTDLLGNALNAAATVVGAAVTLYTRDVNIEVKGGTWNRGSNGFNGGPGFSPLTCTTNLKRIDGLKVHDLTATCTDKGYLLHYGDVRNFHINDITVSGPTGTVNTDGCNGHGPLAFGVVERFYGTCGDDFIALDALDTGITEDTTGDITDTTVADLFPAGNAGAAVTIFGTSASAKMKRITVRGIHGSSLTAAVHVWSGGSSNWIDDLLIENVDNAATGSLINIFVVNAAGQITLRDLSWPSLTAVSGNTMVYIAPSTVLGALTVDGMAFQTAVAPCLGLQVDSGATVHTINVRDLRQMDPTITTDSMVQVKGTVDCLSLEGAHLRMAASPSTYVVDVQGSASVKRLQVSDAWASGAAAILLGLAHGAAAMQVVLNGVTLDGANYLTDCGLTADFVFDGLNIQGIASTQVIWVTNTAAVLTVRGAGIVNPSAITLLGGSTPTSARVISAEVRTDVSLLSRSGAGDIAFNTNAGLACGTGVVLSSGSGVAGSWKNLFSGVTY